MKHKLLPLIAASIMLLCPGCSTLKQVKTENTKPIRVLFTYGGGHHSPITPYVDMFNTLPNIEVVPASLPQSANMLKQGLEKEFDVIVMVQMMSRKSEFNKEQRDNFIKLLDKGIGIIALHQAIATEPDWKESTKIIGGAWRNKPYEVDGVKYEKSGCLHDTDINVIAAKPHPITEGIPNFTINDELYLNTYNAEDNNIVLKTDHPQASGGKEIAWTRMYGKSKIFYFQLGHIPEKTWADKNCRQIIANAIHWASNK
ncbi:ThuA domain-containing protein [Verrucomicrobiota bacterium]